jgi:hypothetical protein
VRPRTTLPVQETHGYEFISISWAGSSPSGKTQRYVVTSNRCGGILGEIKWFGRWRQYVFFPADRTGYSRGCLRDIADFTDSLR